MTKRKGLLILFLLACFTFGAIISELQYTTHLKQHAVTPATTVINKKVYMLIYNPVMPNGQSLITNRGWNAPSRLSQEYSTFLKQVTNNRVNYTITVTKELASFPTLGDGFIYTPQLYLDVVTGKVPHHEPSIANYYTFLNDSTLDICGKVNRGEIDELWLFGGPWMGFHESALATSPNGPPGFAYNGGIYNQTQCQKLVPIMGFSYEREWTEMVHDIGHRTEATMSYVYGGWEENRMDHNWDKFALVKGQSPNFPVAGCGSIHFPPNALHTAEEYRYDLPHTVNSYCDDFQNYPELGIPQAVAKPTSCQAWNCTYPGYLTWWFTHLPHSTGTGPDGVLNDWWVYIIDPNNVPKPTPGQFSGVSGQMYTNQAIFSFTYSGNSNIYTIDVSTLPDMSWEVYLTFASGGKNPIIERNPQKWDKYTCGRTLYWRITSVTGQKSAIQTTQVGCIVAPTPSTILPTSTSTQQKTNLSIQIALHGIGKGGDNVAPNSTGTANPLHPQRQITIELFNASNQSLGNKTGTIIYNSIGGNFHGTVDAGTLPTGNYTARIKVPQYLRKTFPGILAITAGQTIILPSVTLVTGDLNNDHVLSILDYNLLLDCFSDLMPARNCTDQNKKLTTDITDDGNVNQFDYNLLLRELSVQIGQ